MYDTIINYYDVGPGLTGRSYRKTIYDTPTMSVYWLDPAQVLVLNCDGTHDFCEDHDDPLGLNG